MRLLAVWWERQNTGVPKELAIGSRLCLPNSNNRFPFPATLAEIVPKCKEEEKGEAKKMQEPLKKDIEGPLRKRSNRYQTCQLQDISRQTWAT
jgi:hypothetical protein